MQQDQVVLILADISGYTRFMLENRTSAVHGQLCINALIESILEQVDIPLTLQEIEGDAVFLYARDGGSGWEAVLREVAGKLGSFFDVFIARMGLTMESSPCACAICRNPDLLGLKIVVHAGEAMFHEVGGRAQVSGPDVILAHRLLKNSVPSKDYLLLSDPAFARLGPHLPGRFEAREESYEGFGSVPVRVRSLEREALAARDAVYELPEEELQEAVDSYLDWVTASLPAAALAQARRPIRRFACRERLLMLWDALIVPRLFGARLREAIPTSQRARGRRRSSST